MMVFREFFQSMNWEWETPYRSAHVKLDRGKRKNAQQTKQSMKKLIHFLNTII